MKISERIRRVNGEKPDFAIDDIGDIGHWQGMNDAALIAEAEELVQLTDDQQVVVEWLKEAYKRTKWSSPFGTVYSTINIHEMFVRMRLTKVQQFQVLAAFAEWGMANKC